jgi:hypothetical protein
VLALTKNYAWLVPLLPNLWFMQQTRIARTTTRIIRVAAWDWLLTLNGVLESTHRKLIAGAAQRDLESS